MGGLAILFLLALAPPAWADNFTWDGDAADNLWRSEENWDPTGVPGPTDNAIINSGRAIVVDEAFAVNVLTVGSAALVEVVDGFLTVKGILNDGEIRLSTLGGPGSTGGALVIDGAVTYTGTGKLAASDAIGNQLARKLPGDSLTVPSGKMLRLEGLLGQGQLDVTVELEILDGGTVEYSNLAGQMPNGLTSDGELRIEAPGSGLTIRSKVESQGPDVGVLSVGPNASLVLDSALVTDQELSAGEGSIEIRDGTLDTCKTTGGGRVAVTASTTVVESCDCDLTLAESAFLNISGDVSYSGSIFAQGTANIGSVENGRLLVSSALTLNAPNSLTVSPAILLAGTLEIERGEIQLPYTVTGAPSGVVAVADAGSLVITGPGISDVQISLQGQIKLQGTIADSTISGVGSGRILAGGGTLRDVILLGNVIVQGRSTGAQSVSLEGEIGGEPEFTLDSGAGQAKLLAVGQVQLPALTTIEFNGEAAQVRGSQVGNGFVVGDSDRVRFVPIYGGGRAEIFNFTVEAGGTIEGSQLTVVELVNRGTLMATPGGSLTVRGPTDNTGGTICSNGGQVTVVSPVIGGNVLDTCGASSGSLESDGGLAGAVATGSFLVDPAVGPARFTNVTSSATIEVLDGGSLDLRDSFTNDGMVLVQGDLADTTLSLSLDPFTTTVEFHLNGSGELAFSDSIRNLAPTPSTTFTLFNNGNRLRGAVVLGQTGPDYDRVRLVNRGRIEADGVNPFIIDTGAPGSLFYEVQNEGLIEVTGEGGLHVPDNELFNRGEVTIASGSTLEVPAGFFQYLGSTELGGVMDANVTLFGGTYLGGAQPTTGTLSVFGQMRYEPALDTVVPNTFRIGQQGALIVDVGGYEPGVDHDHLSANNTNLAAWVVIRNLPGFTPQVGDEFEFFEYTGTRNGEFAGVLNGTDVPGLEWELLYGGSEFSGGTVTARVSGTGGSAPDLRLEIEALDDPVSPGGTVSFRHTVTNVGAGTAHAVQLELQLPAGLTVNTLVGATCEESGGMLACPLGELGPGAQAVVDLTADIDLTATPPIVLSGTVSGLEAEVGTAPNTAQASSFLCTVATDDLVVSHTLVSTEVNEEACVSIHVGPAVEVEAGGALNLRSPLVVIEDGTAVHAGGNLSVGNR